MPHFYDDLSGNMEGLGLTTPQNLVGSKQTAIATASAILALIDKFGRKVTVLELVGAGTKLEQLAVVGAVNAAFYAGAVIGSIAVAAGRTLAGGRSMSDVLLSAQIHHINRPWLAGVLIRCPGIYRPDVRGRAMYKHQGTYK